MVVGGMHGCRGHVWLLGGGCAWLWGACMVVGGMHGCQGGCIGYDEIRSMSGRYASYWNASLFDLLLVTLPGSTITNINLS